MHISRSTPHIHIHTTTMVWTQPAKSTIKVFDAHTQLDEIASFYEANGLVVFRLLDSDTCRELVEEQWDEVILKQPWVDGIKLTENDKQVCLGRLGQPLPKATLKRFTTGWTLHRGFGACCDPQVFHLQGVWSKVRANPQLVAIAQRLTGGRREQWVDINRSIHKLPGQGESEFLHWDCNPLKDEEDSDNSSIQGKCCYTPSRFVGVLGSHTPEFHRQ